MPKSLVKKPLGELKAGQLGDFFAILVERAKRNTKDGKPYYNLRFRDRKRAVAVPVWSDSPLFEACDKEWQVGQHFKVRAIFQEHPKYGAQIDIQNIRAVSPEDRFDGYDPDSLIERTRFDVNELFEELLGHAGSIEDAGLRELVEGILRDHEQAIKTHPAASRNHHGYRGGYLEHTVSVVRTGVYLAEKYAALYPDLDPPLNRDLVVAGCILHDIGKLQELEWPSEGAPEAQYTPAGHLVGHILLGRDLVRDRATRIENLNPELLLYLDHIITSHQGTPEWGSPKEPMFPEALLVHHADDIDAKFNMFVGIINAYEGQGVVTDTGNILRRRFLRSRTV